MRITCAEARESLVEAPKMPGTACEAHLEACGACRAFRDSMLALIDGALAGDGTPRLDWARLQETVDEGARRLAARQRRQLAAFIGVAAAFLTAFWAGLGSLNPMLPFYLSAGIFVNLSLFFLPIYLVRRRQEG